MAFTFGIKAIKSGDPGAKGAMGNSLSTHDETLEGTAVLDTTDETINWISTEESGRRLAIPQNDSETTLTFEIADPSLETQAYYLGVDDFDPGVDDTLQIPRTQKAMHKSFLVETVEGYHIQIPYGRVNAKPLGGTITRDGVMTMQVQVFAELPEDDNYGRIAFVDPDAVIE